MIKFNFAFLLVALVAVGSNSFAMEVQDETILTKSTVFVPREGENPITQKQGEGSTEDEIHPSGSNVDAGTGKTSPEVPKNGTDKKVKIKIVPAPKPTDATQKSFLCSKTGAALISLLGCGMAYLVYKYFADKKTEQAQGHDIDDILSQEDIQEAIIEHIELAEADEQVETTEQLV